MKLRNFVLLEGVSVVMALRSQVWSQVTFQAYTPAVIGVILLFFAGDQHQSRPCTLLHFSYSDAWLEISFLHYSTHTYFLLFRHLHPYSGLEVGHHIILLFLNISKITQDALYLVCAEVYFSNYSILIRKRGQVILSAITSVFGNNETRFFARSWNKR